jgi:hypothetical protein
MSPRFVVSALFVVLLWPVQAAEVVSQRGLVANFAEIWPSPMTSLLDRDENSLEIQDPGDRELACESHASALDVAVSVRSQLLIRHSVSPTSGAVEVESSFSLTSQGELPTVDTNLTTKAFAWATAWIRIDSDTPYRFALNPPDPPPTSLPLWGVIRVRAANGSQVLELAWSSATASATRSDGSLGPGLYEFEFFTAVEAQGTVSPWLLNPINGSAQALTRLTLFADSSVSTPPPRLDLRREVSGRVLLDLLNLKPGGHYIVERTDVLPSGEWLALGGLTAAGTNAVWVDVVNVESQAMFYRLRE